MKGFRFLVVFCAILISSCGVKKHVPKNETIKDSKGVVLTDEQKRKFDFFFYEGNREKMLGNIDKAGSYYSECLKIDKRSSACMFELANIYISNKQLDKGIQLLEEAVRNNPSNVWYRVFLGEIYQENSQVDNSVVIYRDLVKEYPNNDEYIYTLAQLYAQSKNFKEALDTYSILEKKSGVNETITLEKERILLQLGKEKPAIEEIDKLIKVFPAEIKYLNYKGDLFTFFKNFKDAEDIYRSVLLKDQTNENGLFSLANLYIQKNDTIRFLEYFTRGINSNSVDLELKLQKLLPFLLSNEKGSKIIGDSLLESYLIKLIELNPTDAGGFIFIGNFYKIQNKKQLALSNYETALSISPGNEQLWQDVLLLSLELNNSAQLVAKSSEAILLFPTNTFFYFLKGNGLFREDKSLESLEVLKTGLSYVGDNAILKLQYYSSLGDVYYKLGEIDSSFISYETALKFNDKYLPVLNNYSYYLSLEKRDLDKAEKMSGRCIELEPANNTYLDTYAWVLFVKKLYLESKFIIERAMDNGGDTNNLIIEHYGDILFKNGYKDEAIIQWNKAKELGNDSKILERKILEGIYIEEE